MNAYLTAPIGENIWCICGPEFGVDAGKPAIITRALYGLKSADASFRNHLAKCMQKLGYTSFQGDIDVWRKAMTRPNERHEYYAYILFYVDDILAIQHNAMSALNEIDKFFNIKPESKGYPTTYLGAKLSKVKSQIVWKHGQRAPRNTSRSQ